MELQFPPILRGNFSMIVQLVIVVEDLFDHYRRRVFIIGKFARTYNYHSLDAREKQSAIIGFQTRILAAPIAFSAGAVRRAIKMRIDVGNLSFSKSIELTFRHLKNSAVAAHPEI